MQIRGKWTLAVLAGLSLGAFLGGCGDDGDNRGTCGSMELLATPLPEGEVGKAYSATLGVQGGEEPYQFTISLGLLPGGLTLDMVTGVISGKPNQVVQDFPINITVTDSCPTTNVATMDFYITIRGAVGCSPLEVATSSLASATVDQPYSTNLSSSGGHPPFLWSIKGGDLPDGVDLSEEGQLSGTPASEGDYTFTVEVTDSCEPQGHGEASLTLNVVAGSGQCPTVRIVDTMVPQAELGEPYELPFEARGGTSPFSWDVVEGALPQGLDLRENSGILMGMPLEAGTFPLTIRVEDSCPDGAMWSEREMTLEVLSGQACDPLSITPRTLDPAQIDQSYEARIRIQGGQAPFVFDLGEGSLPAGVILDPTEGLLEGTPEETGLFAFTVEVLDSCEPPQEASQEFILEVLGPSCAELDFYTLDLPLGQVGSPYDFQLGVQGEEPFIWELVAGVLPDGLSLDGDSGLISGLPGLEGTFAFTVQVTDGCADPQTFLAELTLVITPQEPCDLLSFLPPNLGEAHMGEAYTANLTADGGRLPLTWEITDGTLPSGLTLDSASGIISGTPSAPGDFSFTVTVRDSCDTPQEVSLVLSISVSCSPLTIVSTSMDWGTSGQPYHYAMEVEGGSAPLTFSVEGNLPRGISFNSETGSFSGVPSEAGAFPFVLSVTDSCDPPQAASRDFSLVINSGQCPTLSIVTLSLDAATLGTFYSAQLYSTGGVDPIHWVISSGELPQGISLDGAEGIISGIPEETGPFSVEMAVQDSCPTPQLAKRTFEIMVQGPPCTQVQISGASLPAAQLGNYYNAQLTATGGELPYLWSVTSGHLPDGLALDPLTGEIYGVPTVLNIYSFDTTVTDSCPIPQTDSISLRISVAPPTNCDALVLTTTSLPLAQLNQPYSASLTITGGVEPFDYAVESGDLPPGITLDPATGALTGRPTHSGSYTFKATVTDDCSIPQISTQVLTIRVISQACPSLRLPSRDLPNARLGEEYEAAVLPTGGVPPMAWNLIFGALPSGLALDEATGVISGVPLGQGSFTFMLRVTDSCEPPQGVEEEFQLTVIPDACTILSLPGGELPAATVGVSYSAQIASAPGQGGTGGLTFAVDGPLPDGITLDPATGDLSGTPEQAGTFAFLVTATDSCSTPQSAGATYYIPVSSIACPAVVISTSILPEANLDQGYEYDLQFSGGTAPLFWSLVEGSLPPGTYLDETSGTLWGVPLLAGEFPFKVMVRDSCEQMDQKSMSLSVHAPLCDPLAFVTNALPDGDVDVPYSSEILLSGGLGGVAFSLTAGDLPPGLELGLSTGDIIGVPTASGTFDFTVQVSDECPEVQTIVRGYSITISREVCSDVFITTRNIPAATVDEAYSFTFAATGGTPPLVWNIAAEEIPPGLALEANGTIHGVPTQPGSFVFTVDVVDSCSTPRFSSADFTLNVTPATCPPLSMSSTPPPATMVNTTYEFLFTAQGGSRPLIWTLEEPWPAGMEFDPTGLFHGTPTASGSFDLAVQVTDSCDPPQVDEGFFTFVISPEPCNPLVVSTSSLPDATYGSPYEVSLVATGGSPAYFWSLPEGGLPPGLRLTYEGLITGTPTQAGTFPILVRVTDSCGLPQVVEVDLILEVLLPSCPALNFTAPVLPTGAMGEPYSAFLGTPGGQAPLSWIALSDNIPPGLELNSATGEIHGVPTLAGTAQIAIRVVDSCALPQISDDAITIEITCPTLRLNTTVLPEATLGLFYSATLSASGGMTPFFWDVTQGSLPDGLVLNPETGEILGVPLTQGNFQFEISVYDSCAPRQQVSRSLSLRVGQNPCPPVMIMTGAFPMGLTGWDYSFTAVAAGGTAPLTWSITAGSLPQGLSLNASTGEVSGTPTLAGLFAFTLTVADSCSDQRTDADTFSITIENPPCLAIAIIPEVPPPAVQGQEYYFAPTAVGGTQSYTWSLVNGALPNGLTLDAQTGEIAGTPTATGFFEFTLQVCDDCYDPQCATQTFPLMAGVWYEESGVILNNTAIWLQNTCAMTPNPTPYDIEVNNLGASHATFVVSLRSTLDPVGIESANLGETATFTFVGTDEVVLAITFLDVLDCSIPHNDSGAVVDIRYLWP